MKNQKETEKLNIILRTNDMIFNKIYAIIQNSEGGNVMSLLKMLLIFYGESAIFTFVTCEIFMKITMKRIEKEERVRKYFFLLVVLFLLLLFFLVILWSVICIKKIF